VYAVTCDDAIGRRILTAACLRSLTFQAALAGFYFRWGIILRRLLFPDPRIGGFLGHRGGTWRWCHGLGFRLTLPLPCPAASFPLLFSHYDIHKRLGAFHSDEWGFGATPWLTW
jgi:hypothetical protein